MVLPEHIAVAARDADIDTVRAWLATNDVNEVSIGGGDWGPRTLLQCAVDTYVGTTAAHVDLARMLLARGADVTERTEDGCPPLHYACRGLGDSCVAMVKLFIAAGAGVNSNDGTTPLSLAIYGFTFSTAVETPTQF